MFRPYGTGTTTGKIQIKDSNNFKELKIIIKKVVSKESSWTRVRFVFCIPPNTKNITLSLYRSAGSGIDWDDVSIKKI